MVFKQVNDSMSHSHSTDSSPAPVTCFSIPGAPSCHSLHLPVSALPFPSKLAAGALACVVCLQASVTSASPLNSAEVRVFSPPPFHLLLVSAHPLSQISLLGLTFCTIPFSPKLLLTSFSGHHTPDSTSTEMPTSQFPLMALLLGLSLKCQGILRPLL